MTLDDRIADAEQRFTEAQLEMYRCQGEYRALVSLKDEESEPAAPTDEAATIEVIPAKEQ